MPFKPPKIVQTRFKLGMLAHGNLLATEMSLSNDVIDKIAAAEGANSLNHGLSLKRQLVPPPSDYWHILRGL